MAWGSTVGAETAAQRYARDVSQRGGEVKYNNAGVPSTIAAAAAGGRNDREFDKRGDDLYYTYDVNGNPVLNTNDNGRNEREYVNAANGTSALAAVFGTD